MADRVAAGRRGFELGLEGLPATAPSSSARTPSSSELPVRTKAIIEVNRTLTHFAPPLVLTVNGTVAPGWCLLSPGNVGRLPVGLITLLGCYEVVGGAVVGGSVVGGSVVEGSVVGGAVVAGSVVGGAVVGGSVVGGAVVGGSVVGGAVVGGAVVGGVVVGGVDGGAVVGGLVPGGVVLGGGVVPGVVVPGGWVTPVGAGTPGTATGPAGGVVSVGLIGLMD
jgi:hypothetical protein